jgi:hypothetical protein
MSAKRLMIQALPVMLLGLLVTAESATAQGFPPITILDADYGGTGCPDGTASVVIAGDTLSMLFDAYVAETWPGHRTDRKSCNFAVALLVPAGFTVAILRIDYRGFADIPGPPYSGMGMLFAEYFWAGSEGPIQTRYFWPGFFGNWMETDLVGGAVWSPCGGEVIARANTSAVARKSSPYSPYEAMVQVDSVDLQAGIIYHFIARPC